MEGLFETKTIKTSGKFSIIQIGKHSFVVVKTNKPLWFSGFRKPKKTFMVLNRLACDYEYDTITDVITVGSSERASEVFNSNVLMGE